MAGPDGLELAMVEEPIEPEPGADWSCARCGHSEEDHEEEEFEGPEGPRRSTYCLACAEWHELVPEPDEPVIE